MLAACKDKVDISLLADDEPWYTRTPDFPEVIYDEETSQHHFELAQDIFGDLLHGYGN